MNDKKGFSLNWLLTKVPKQNKRRAILERCADKWGRGLVIPQFQWQRSLVAASLARRTGESYTYILMRLDTLHKMGIRHEQERNDSSLEKKNSK